MEYIITRLAFSFICLATQLYCLKYVLNASQFSREQNDYQPHDTQNLEDSEEETPSKLERVPSYREYIPQFKPQKFSVDEVGFHPSKERLLCSICSFIFHNPVTLKCGHSFCQDCFLQWRKIKSTCPECKSNISSKDRFKKSIVINSIIDDLPVCCVSHKHDSEKKCQEKLSIKDLERHWKSCPHIKLECKCGDLILNSSFLESDTICKCPKFTCKYCSCEFQGRLLNYHSDSCRREEVRCKLCGSHYVREFKEHHDDYECFSYCPYREFGCQTFKLTPKQLKDHIRHSESSHKLLKIPLFHQ